MPDHLSLTIKFARQVAKGELYHARDIKIQDAKGTQTLITSANNQLGVSPFLNIYKQKNPREDG